MVLFSEACTVQLIFNYSVICSDAMARGMDVENVKYVISYDPPPFIKTYIHRVGRTARAGKVGTAITMLQKKEVCCVYYCQPSYNYAVR